MKVYLNVLITEDLQERLTKHVLESGINKSLAVRRALERYLHDAEDTYALLKKIQDSKKKRKKS